MPQAKRKAAAKKAAAKKPAAKKQPEPEIQTNRTAEETPPVTDTPTTENQDPPVQGYEETDEERAAAGDARREKVSTPGQLGKDPEVVYEPEREPLEHANFDHYGAEEKRQTELQRERDEHNRRTGDASRP